jgi:hypothetical protein
MERMKPLSRDGQRIKIGLACSSLTRCSLSRKLRVTTAGEDRVT